MDGESFLRDDNYFIRVPPMGWVLIEGTWYEALEGQARPDTATVVFPQSPMTPWPVNPADFIFPTHCTVTYFTWQRVHWHPGTDLPAVVVRATAQVLADAVLERPRHSTVMTAEDIDHDAAASWVELGWNFYQARRVRHGWRALPDGRLPAQFNRFEPEETTD